MISYHLGDEIKKCELDWVCGKFERDERLIEVFRGERRKRPLGRSRLRSNNSNKAYL